VLKERPGEAVANLAAHHPSKRLRTVARINRPRFEKPGTGPYRSREWRFEPLGFSQTRSGRVDHRCPCTTETKLTPFCIDSMRAIYLLWSAFGAFYSTGKGFSNCTGGKEELELRMRDALHLSETSTAATKSNKPLTRRRSAGRRLSR
jgi:hypothetical protein